MKRNSKLYRKLAFKAYLLKKECEKCGKTEGKICVHHIDENQENNKKDNFQILCDFCHKRLHSTGKQYCLGRKLSEKHKEKLSKALKGRVPWTKGKKLSQEHKDKLSKNNAKSMLGRFGKNHNCSKKVNQYTIEGKFIKTFGSIIEAGKETKTNKSCITAVCKGKRKTTGGYKWKLYENCSF